MKELDGKQIESLIDKAIEIKKNQQKYWKALENKTLAMIFQKTSTRTRVSFEVAMTQLGGHAIYLDWRTTQFIMADIRDETKTVAKYVDIIMARLLRHAELEKMAGVSTVPVINGLCEKYHPCQILGDLMTIKEKKGKLRGLKVVYVGLANNISNTLTIGCTRAGMHFTLCAPERHPISLDQSLIDEAKRRFEERHPEPVTPDKAPIAEAKGTGLYDEEKDPRKAVEGADIIYTDTWVDMELFLDPKFEEEKKRRMTKFMPYQLNKKLLEGSDALIMHDMPIHRDYEIDDYAVDSPNSIIFEQAENRLHIQKAIMLWLLGKIKL
jgi:ornithine carbamoyltransferase